MAKKAEKGVQSKAESITVRVNPKIKYGLELLSRKQHRTLTSVVEWALNKALTDPEEGLWRLRGVHKEFHLEQVWDVTEPDRFINLVYFDLSLLTFEEELLWKLICENAYYWYGFQEEQVVQWDIRNKERLLIDRIKVDWETLNLVAKGEKEPISLPWYVQSQRHGEFVRYIHLPNPNTYPLIIENPALTSDQLLTEDEIPF